MAAAQKAVAPWVRTRLRTAPGAAVALALLVLLTSCLAAAFPRAVDRYQDEGLRHAVAEEAAGRMVLNVTTTDPGIELPPEQREQQLREAFTRRAEKKITGSLKAPFAADPRESSYGVRTPESMAATDDFLPQPYGLPAEFTMTAQGGLAAHAKVTSGRLPAAGATATRIEAAVTEETARRLHLKAGSVLHIPNAEAKTTSVRITGVVAPRNPSGAYWSAAPQLRTAQLRSTDTVPPERYWVGALLLHPDAGPVLTTTTGGVEQYWQLAPATAALTASELPALKEALAYTTSGPGLLSVRVATGSPTTDVSTGLADVIRRYEELSAGITPVVSVAAYGTGTVACIVLLMAGGLGADRRRSELALLRARGGSLRGIGGRLLAETAVVAVPAGAVGCALGLLAVPHGRWTRAALAAAAVVVVACAALPVRAMLAHRSTGLNVARDDVATARPSARRTVAELTVLVLAVGAIVALRRRGATDGGDSLVSLAPVLVGVVAAFVLVRIYPLPLRRLVGPAGRLRGAVGHLSLARAARARASAGTAVLPLLALLTALTTAAFGGSVLAGIDGARDRAALLATGADARVDAGGPLSDRTVSRVRATRGVDEVTTVSVRYDAEILDSTRRVPLAAVAPDAYARLARHTGLGAFGARELKPSGGTTLPALVSPSMAALFERGRLTLWMNGEEVPLRIAAVRDTTPALPDDFLVVDATALAHATGVPSRTTALLLTGSSVDAPALRKAAGTGTTVRVRAVERAHYVDSPLQTGATGIYVAAVAAGAGLAALALLLALARATPERLALLARLRTMGLTRPQARRLLILEALPQSLLAAAGGALTGWAAVRLLAPGLDLTSLALGEATSASAGRLHTDALSLLVPAACVLLLTVGVAALQAWWSGRRGSVRELRAGEGV
ncbi:FtsX-like permease family protein [Streptomyces sp. NPDC050400]|uniref:FtsX-like permease family protein n=1 Tax=Streptomyces sp. NPDC050400 TaxID=3365610 RepID=UPI0037913B8C